MAKAALRTPTIRDFIQAGYPCLFMPTIEAEVAKRRVEQAMTDLEMTNVQYGEWKATTGLHVARGLKGQKQERGQDLLEALKFVESSKEPCVVLFHNVRQFVANYQVIQGFIDATMAARLHGSHVILLGPYLELPAELRNLVTYVDCPLPSRDAIAQEYKKMLAAYKDEISKSLPKDQAELEKLVLSAATAAVGLDMLGAENALALSLATTESVDVRVIQAQKEQEVRKSDVLEFISTDETLDDVGGFDVLKDWMHKRQRCFTDEARKFGLPYPKGILIVGPAGTGKSLTAKAVASFLGLPLLRLDMGKVFRSLVGESESAIRMALQVAEAVSPVVLWMDEIDKGLAGMRGSGELDSGVTARVISTILTWRQETKYPVVLAATANDVASIPAMVYRKGRLDEVWATDLPHAAERTEIFRIHLRKRGRDPEKFNCEALAEQCDGFTGAEIESCVEDAMFAAFDQEAEDITPAHLLRAIRETIPAATRDREELVSIREWVKTRARLVSSQAYVDEEKEKGKVRQIKPQAKKD